MHTTIKGANAFNLIFECERWAQKSRKDVAQVQRSTKRGWVKKAVQRDDSSKGSILRLNVFCLSKTVVLSPFQVPKCWKQVVRRIHHAYSTRKSTAKSKISKLKHFIHLMIPTQLHQRVVYGLEPIPAATRHTWLKSCFPWLQLPTISSSLLHSAAQMLRNTFMTRLGGAILLGMKAS